MFKYLTYVEVEIRMCIFWGILYNGTHISVNMKT